MAVYALKNLIKKRRILGVSDTTIRWSPLPGVGGIKDDDQNEVLSKI